MHNVVIYESDAYKRQLIAMSVGPWPTLPLMENDLEFAERHESKSVNNEWTWRSGAKKQAERVSGLEFEVSQDCRTWAAIVRDAVKELETGQFQPRLPPQQ